MTEKITASSIGKQDKGQAKVSSDDNQTMVVSEQNQSGGSAAILPLKKRWADEAKTKQEYDLKKIPHKNTSAPSNQHKESKVEDDQSERNLPGPGSRVLSREMLREAYCLSKTLNSFEVILENPKLYLDPCEASLLTDCHEILDYLPCSYSKNLLVFDGADRRYDMVLSQYSKGGTIRYSITGDWNRFVKVHNLKAGDEMTFYRILDKNVSDDHYYILKYFRKPADHIGDVPNRRKQNDARQKDFKGSHTVKDNNKKSEKTELKDDKIPQEKASASSDKLQSKVERYAPMPASWPSSSVKGSYKVEDKYKESKQIKLNFKISHKNAGVPSIVLKESNIEDNQVPLQYSPDQTEKYVAAPVSERGSSVLPREAKCLSKKLKSIDVIPQNPMLHLDAHEARILTDCPELSDHPRGTYSKKLLVYDGENRAYDMLLYFSSDEWIGYLLDAEWKRFVWLHKLKAGDELTFYRTLDNNISDDYYYILKYFRKPADHIDHVPDSKRHSDARQKDFHKVKDKQKESEKTELKVEEIPQEKASVSSDKLQSKVERYVPMPVSWPSSRDLSNDDYCLSKTLTSLEVVAENPMLYLDVYEASILTDSPELLHCIPAMLSKTLLVVDKDDTQYDMLLSPHTKGEWVGYSLSEDWEVYLLIHKLKAGDEITFYRILDRNICDEHYYILTYSRKTSDSNDCAPNETNPSDAGKEDFKVKDKNKELDQSQIKMIRQEKASVLCNRNQKSQVKDDQTVRIVPGAGSRALTPQEYLLTKTLGSNEVIPGNAKLYIDGYEARMFTDNTQIADYVPGSFSKNLVVFDGDDRRYDMLLAHHISGGLIGFSITGNWNRFVRTHNLEAGDEITFYRILDTSVSDDYYYVLRSRKKLTGSKGRVTPVIRRKYPKDDSQKDSKLKGKLSTLW